jgi:predicted glycosyltransferase
MNIWFDLSNSPHINLFYELIRDLESLGHGVIITCRPLANTIDLLDQKGMKYTVIGEHYGKNFYKKLFGYPIRVYQLRSFLRKHKIQLAVSQSSFHSPIVAKLLGIPSIYTNDNEHALGNVPSFIFASKIFLPENSSASKAIKQGASIKKITKYPGIKEGIYLWRLGETISQNRKKRTKGKIKIYVRPEPLTAQYYKGGLNFLDDTLIRLQDRYSITVLPRDKVQFSYYKQAKFSSIHVPDKPLQFTEIAEDCSLFLGAGGSMTRELAILGIPTISIYQDSLLDVDKFLIQKNLMWFDPEISADKVIRYITQLQDSVPDTELLSKGREAYKFFLTEILKYNKS